MLFNSFKFILLFLPAFFLSYYLINDKFKNAIIFVYSIIFYFYGCFDNIEHLFVLLGSIIINYLLSIAIYNLKNKFRTIIFILALIFNIGILIHFKYFNFFIDIITKFGCDIEKVNIVLPLGISFYTMQIISYIVDIYKGDVEVDKKFINFATYVLMFPQLVAGPIVRYKSIKKELIHKSLDYNNIFTGLNYFIYGLSSKVICANFLSYVQIDVTQHMLDFSTMLAWLGAGCFMLQLYFDFNGYSMMAKGLCKMIGIDILDNFNCPLLSKSVTEFWRKWHISLSNFLRDYIYIPLGGGKKGLIKTLINLFIVFFISGLWHGANYSFIIFGVGFAFFMIIERLFLFKILDKTRFIGHIYMLMVVFTVFVFFAHEDLDECFMYVKNMFFFGENFCTESFFEVVKINYKAIILGIIFTTKLPNILGELISRKRIINIIILILLFIINLYIINLGYNDPFMYFRF